MILRRSLLAGVGAAIAAMTERSPARAQAPTTQSEGRGMEVTRSGTQPSQTGPAENFTGMVKVDSRFRGSAPARIGGGIVSFEPGARTAWHTHPLGQTLFITAGRGWVQVEGGAKEEVRPGDIVWFAPGVKHWHGAGPTTAMSHLAVSEALDGKSVDWLEHVSDAQYRA